MTLRNIFLKMAEEVKRYPNIVQLTNTLNKGFKQVADNINGGGSDVVVTPAYTSGEKLATITVNDVDNEIYMPNGEVKTMTGTSFKTVNGSLVDEMKVGFTPIQSGSGTPSPDNVRPISGHTQVQSEINGNTNTTSLGGTEYCGILDMVSGEGEVTYKITTTFSRGAIDSSGKLYKVGEINDGIANADANYTPDLICNLFQALSFNASKDGTPKSITQWGKNLYVSGYVGDESALDTLLSNMAVVYPLATPTALTLTGQNITADVGVNNVSAPGTNQEIIEVKYHQVMTLGDVAKLIE